MKNNRVFKFITSNILVISIQTILSSVLLYFILKLDVLPMKHLFLVIAILLVLVLLVVLVALLGIKYQKRWLCISNKVISILLSIVLIGASLFVNKSEDLFGNFGKNYKSYAVSVIVLKESKATQLQDLKGKKFEAVTNTGGVILANALENIEKDIEEDIELSPSKSLVEMTQALYDGKSDAIILNEMNRDLIKDEIDDFNLKTKVIYQTSIKEEISNASSNADITKETTTIFVSGNDLYDGEDEEVLKRSDVNMLVTINPNTRQLLMVSVPRDTYVELASFNGMDKLTHASIYGLQESVDTLSNFFDCDIDYYTRINYSSLLKIVNALDGITIDNPQEFTSTFDTDNSEGTTHYPKGKNKLYGERALIYSRERQAFEEGDNMRILNQQRVLEGIIDKALSPTIITRYSKILDSIDGAFETNITDRQIKSMIQFQLEDMKGWDIQSAHVIGIDSMSTECISMPGTELFVSKPDQDSVDLISQYIEMMENDEVIDTTIVESATK